VHDCGGIKVLKKNDGKCSNNTSAFKFRGLRSTIFVIFAVKNDGMTARNIIQDKNKINTTSSKIVFS